MARVPEDREDLLRDATAYVQRAQLELVVEGQAVEVFAGFRLNSAASFYFEQDPVYHFNADSELRRAFIDGKLIKAESGSLVAWTRQRTDGEVAMLCSTLNDSAQRELLDDARRNLDQLHNAIVAGEALVVGEVRDASETSVVDRLVAYLARMPTIAVASSPQVGG
ncbi:MAG: hypothetical protein AAGD11_14510 [Planctomycetota bacterium]